MGAGVSLYETNDNLLWTGGNSTGKVTVENIYYALISTQDFPIWRGWKVNIWKWKLQLKIKLFIWMAAKNRILSWDVLQRRT
jgi:hypothetical protein